MTYFIGHLDDDVRKEIKAGLKKIAFADLDLKVIYRSSCCSWRYANI